MKKELKNLHLINIDEYLHEIRLLYAFCGENKSRPGIYKSLYVDFYNGKIRICSTNGWCLCRLCIDDNNKNLESGNWVAEEVSENRLLLYKNDRDFPNYEHVMPKISEYTVIRRTTKACAIIGILGISGIVIDSELATPIIRYSEEGQKLFSLYVSKKEPERRPVLISTSDGKIEIVIAPLRPELINEGTP